MTETRLEQVEFVNKSIGNMSLPSATRQLKHMIVPRIREKGIMSFAKKEGEEAADT